MVVLIKTKTASSSHLEQVDAYHCHSASAEGCYELRKTSQSRFASRSKPSLQPVDLLGRQRSFIHWKERMGKGNWEGNKRKRGDRTLYRAENRKVDVERISTKGDEQLERRESDISNTISPKHPVSCIEPGLATRFIHDILQVSMPVSQIFPSSPSLTESIRLFYTSVSLLLSCTQGYCFYIKKKKDLVSGSLKKKDK